MIDEVFIQPTECTNANQTIYSFCFPDRVECLPTPLTGRLVDCSMKWNCIYAQCQVDRRYDIPFVKGDKIQIQTLEYVGSPNNVIPYDDIFTIEPCTHDGTPFAVEGLKMSAWKDSKPYQIIELDTTNFPDCWSLRFLDSNGDELFCTQEFKIANCKETVLIQSKRTSRDCFGYCYGNPDVFNGDEIVYNNSLRYFGFLKNTSFSDSFERLESNGLINSEAIQDVFNLKFPGKMPLFAKNILKDQLLTGGEICVNNRDFFIDGFTATNELETGTMWSFAVEVYELCEDRFGGC